MAEPLVSIIVPLYNAEKYIGEAIASAMAQTWPFKEILVVDDGSTDRSLSIAQTYQSDWVKVISQPNKGASAARNTGLKHATGNFIQFLDADDLLSEDKIELQVKALKNAPGKIAVCSTIHFTDGSPHKDSTPSAYEEQFLIDSDNPAWFLTHLWGGYGDNGSMVQPNAWLTPREIIEKAGPWNETLTVDDDGEYFCRVLLQANGIVKTGGYNYYRKYTNNNFSLSASKLEKHYTSLIHSLGLRYDHISSREPTDALKKAYARSLQSVYNSMYPAYPLLRRSIKQSIKKLGITSPEYLSPKEKVKKRARSILGPQFTNFLKGNILKPPQK